MRMCGKKRVAIIWGPICIFATFIFEPGWLSGGKKKRGGGS